jgi:predicted nucleotidyltransferase
MEKKRGAEKPTRTWDQIENKYDDAHWELLRTLRAKALDVMTTLEEGQISAIVHGSVARGDVDSYSDVDVVIPYVVPSHRVEISLGLKGFELYSRKIAQATPSHSPKGHIYLDPQEKVSVTFPLLDLRSLELDFFKFGGVVDVQSLKKEVRVAGCTKKLTLIEPTPYGHMESSVMGREAEVARKVGVSVDIVKERIRVLTRRDRIGRTGIFLLADLGKDETFESMMKRLVDTNPAVRRIYLSRTTRIK